MDRVPFPLSPLISMNTPVRWGMPFSFLKAANMVFSSMETMVCDGSEKRLSKVSSGNGGNSSPPKAVDLKPGTTASYLSLWDSFPSKAMRSSGAFLNDPEKRLGRDGNVAIFKDPCRSLDPQDKIKNP